MSRRQLFWDRFFFGVVVALAASADPLAGNAKDKEIMAHLDFYSNLDVAEALPLLENFGEVIDQATDPKKRRTPPPAKAPAGEEEDR